jgi:hypothetical protein
MITDPLDKNKTTLTHKITALATAYLDAIGCKPIETEVPIKNYGVIDIGSFVYPTMTELRKTKIFKVIFAESNLYDYDMDTIYKERYGFLTTVGVEVKVSVADFQKDYGKKYSEAWYEYQPPIHWGYLAVPKLLVEKVDKIHCWGKIICSDDGEKVLKVHPPSVTPMHPGDIADFVASVAIRREHRTRYRVMRDWLKAHRATL